MDVVCDKCHTKIKIPESKLEKIPPGHIFSINCPKCKNKLSVENKKAASPPPEKPAAKSPAPAAQKPAEKSSPGIEEESSTGSPFGFLEEGAQTALICEPDSKIRDKIHEILKRLEYHVSTPPSPREALKQMRAHEFQVIVLNERFGTPDPEANHVLKYTSSLKMNIRRNMFVLLISHRFPTFDKMKAFNKSVNVIVNLKDIDEFEKYFTNALREHDAFYRVFKESFVKIKG